MRVLMCNGAARGGFVVYTGELVDRLERIGIDVTVAAPLGLARRAPSLPPTRWGDEVAGWSRPRLLATRLVESASRTVAFVGAVRSVEPDVVHLQTPLTPRWDASLIAWTRRRAPVVVTVHNAVPHEEGRRDASEHRRWRAADALVVHGEQAEGTVRQVAPEAVVRVIPVDLLGHRPPVAKAEARARLRLGDDPAAVALGLVRPYKGFDLLAGAWPRVRAAVPTARLFVVGAAPRSFDALDELCALPGVERRDGWIDDDEFEQWAAAADVAVLPYRHGVHSGVLHRAVSNGTPVLASPPLREEVERYQAGRVVPLEVAEWASALATALGGDPLPPPSPPPESQARKHAELYRELLAARRPTAAAHEAMEVGG